ncbi:hypothetical protein ACTL6P_15500 [Endozoicomonas acroporae]|uniref:hypothetical protein n=1 Tax=Endozoicomonas acroporae TaxID=1701104 RepID=UPI000C7952CA|nr:hypothetical protein [Endozoicomonas acroporae]
MIDLKSNHNIRKNMKSNDKEREVIQEINVSIREKSKTKDFYAEENRKLEEHFKNKFKKNNDNNNNGDLTND